MRFTLMCLYTGLDQWSSLNSVQLACISWMTQVSSQFCSVFLCVKYVITARVCCDDLRQGNRQSVLVKFSRETCFAGGVLVVNHIFKCKYIILA